MKKIENATTADEMIEIEIQKINNGSRNESNLLRLTFLNELKKELENSWARINSSRDREESQYIWRAVHNEINWIETLLLQGKSIAMTRDIDALRKSQAEFPELELLKTQRDMTKASYYQGVNDYERFVKEQEALKRDGLYDSKIDMKPAEILQVVQAFDEDARLAFWLEYFKLADKFIYTSQIEANGKTQKGE